MAPGASVFTLFLVFAQPTLSVALTYHAACRSVAAEALPSMCGGVAVPALLPVLQAAGAVLAVPVAVEKAPAAPVAPLLAWAADGDDAAAAAAPAPQPAAVQWVYMAAQHAVNWALPTARSGWLVPHVWTRLDGTVHWATLLRLVQALAFHLCERPGLSEVRCCVC